MREVHVVSFPKSGRTWVEVMVNHVTGALTGLDLGALLRREVGVGQSGRTDVPPVVFGHGHDNGRLCRDSIFATGHYHGAHVALLVRNPRDVLVSHYYAAKYHYQAFDATLDEFIDHDVSAEPIDSLACRFGLAPIIAYMNGWATNADCLGRFDVVFYEDVRLEPELQLCRLCDFLGVPASSAEIRGAVEFASVDNMRAIEAAGGFGWHALAGSDDPRGRKVRRAKVGGYLEEMAPATIERVDDEIDRRLHPMFDRYTRAGVSPERTARVTPRTHAESPS
jgi:hypothetical protein